MLRRACRLVLRLNQWRTIWTKHQRLVAEHRLDQVVIDTEQIEKLCQVGRVPFAVKVGFGYSDVAAVQ